MSDPKTAITSLSGIALGTPDSDKGWSWRQRVSGVANSIAYYQACLNAVPSFPENERIIQQYLRGFQDACADMKDLLDGQN
jgi:hypothetical protein